MQRNAILFSTIVALAVTGCNNLGGPPRRFANNPPAPSVQSQATAPDLQNSYANDNARQLRSSLEANPYEAALFRTANAAKKQQDGSGIPVVTSDRMAGVPDKPKTAQHVCDENCGHSHGVVGPDGVIGLPQFRLSELSDDEKQEITNPVASSQQPPDQEVAVTAEPAPETVQVTVSPTTSAAETMVTIPVAQPIEAPSSPAQPAPQFASASSRNTQPESSPATSQNPATESPLATNSTIRSQASMQVQVVDADANGMTIPTLQAAMPELQLPPIQGELANALRRNSDSDEMAEPEIVVPPSSTPEPKVVQFSPEVVPPSAPQPSATTSGSGSQPASSAGIRVDPTLRNPWSSSQAFQPTVAPATTQPVLRIPAHQQQRFNAPVEPALLPNKNSPSATDLLVKPASFQEPVEPPTNLVAAKTADCQNCLPTACTSADCQSAGKCVCGNFQQKLRTGSIGPIPLILQGQHKSDQSTDLAPGIRLLENPQMQVPDGGMMKHAGYRPGTIGSRPAAGLPSQPGLSAPVAALTTEITGFGNYERLTTKQFQPGQTILLYCELTGYSSLEKTVREGTEFQTTLESQLMVTDASGKTVQQDSFPVLNDVSHSRRNDFYMYVPFKVGKLPAGNYEVMLRVRDANNNSSAIAGPVSFSVK